MVVHFVVASVVSSVPIALTVSVLVALMGSSSHIRSVVKRMDGNEMRSLRLPSCHGSCANVEGGGTFACFRASRRSFSRGIPSSGQSLGKVLVRSPRVRMVVDGPRGRVRLVVGVVLV